jgi:hypothetical protein
MSITLIDFSSALLGTFTLPRHSILESLPPWLEAGVFGLFLGAYIGLLCAFLYRRRMARTVTRLRVRSTSRHESTGRRESAGQHPVSQVCVAETIHQVEQHLDQLSGVSGPHQPDAWGEILSQYRNDFERLRGQVE